MFSYCQLTSQFVLISSFALSRVLLKKLLLEYRGKLRILLNWTKEKLIRWKTEYIIKKSRQSAQIVWFKIRDVLLTFD